MAVSAGGGNLRSKVSVKSGAGYLRLFSHRNVFTPSFWKMADVCFTVETLMFRISLIS